MNAELGSAIKELDEQLIENRRFDRDLFDKLTELQISSGITHGRRPLSPFLRPYFLPASRYRAICRAAAILSGAFERLTDAALNDPALMRSLGLDAKERQFAAYDPGYRAVSVTSRLDTFLSTEGFKFLEYNAETPAGVGDQHILNSIFEHVPEVRAFLAANGHFYPQPHIKLLDTMLHTYREWGGRKESPGIAIVDWEGVDTAGEFDILREFFESRGLPTIICDPSDLEYEGDILRAGPFEIDILYKRVIIHEFLDRCDDNHPLSKAVAAGSVCMINSFRSKIPHKKACLAILSDSKYHRLFTAEQLAMVDQHIPWTRIVSEGETTYGPDDVDLLEFLRAERHRFVLKPNDDYGGKGIAFGWENTESEWDSAIAEALASDYVVQERANVERIKIPVFRNGEAHLESLNVDFDPYLFNGEVEGGMVRLADSSLVNITQGGGETALVVLESF